MTVKKEVINEASRGRWQGRIDIPSFVHPETITTVTGKNGTGFARRKDTGCGTSYGFRFNQLQVPV